MTAPHALTREKIEEYGRNLSAGQFHTTATFLLAHDAAQRQALTQQAQRITELEEQWRKTNAQYESAAKAVTWQAQEIERLTKNAAGQDVRINALRKYLAEYITKQHNAETALAAMTAERNAAETERIEWVLRAERAESLVEEIKEVRDEYHQQWMDALESEERGKAQLTASEQELMKVRAEKDEQWVKLCAALLREKNWAEDYALAARQYQQQVRRLRGILQAILNADERGQGLPFQEAMQTAHKALKGA